MTSHDHVPSAPTEGGHEPLDPDLPALWIAPSPDPTLPAFPLRGRELVWSLGALGVMVAMFSLVGVVVTNTLVGFDESSARWFVDQRTAGLTTGAETFSWLADTTTIVPLALVAAGASVAVTRRWRGALTLLLALALEAQTFFLTSIIIGRERPAIESIGQQPTTASFPSGHAGAATVVFIGLGLLLAWRLRRRALGWALLVLGAVVAVGVAVARVYLAMHHVTDVMTGVLVGLVALVAAARIVDGGVGRHRPAAERTPDEAAS